MQAVITLGVAFAERFPDDTTQVVLTVAVPAEFTPDQIFTAANAIEDVDTDCARLQGWQQEIRRELDRRRAPSMSVGDTIQLVSEAGELLPATWRCDSFGWSRLDSSVI